jgi:hypothetical protein
MQDNAPDQPPFRKQVRRLHPEDSRRQIFPVKRERSVIAAPLASG